MAVALSVIIPCYGHGIELTSCLDALMSQQAHVEYEVIVVDSSPNQSVEEIMKRFPRVRLIRSQKRLFQGAARNLGVRNAAGEHIAFIDADCIPSPEWVEQAYRSAQNGYPMTGGSITDVLPVHPLAWVDNRLQFSDFQSGHPAGVIKHVPSCNMVISKIFFEKLGGFSEDLLTGEDVLLTTTLKEHGAEIWFNPTLSVQHYGRRTWRGFFEHQRSHGYYRGLLGLFVTDTLERIGRNPLLVWLMIPRRLGYVGIRTIQFDPRGIVRFLLSLPLILIGLVAWTIGFHQGVKQRNDQQ